MPKKAPLILTLQPDLESQAFFDAQRKLYFPPERNLLSAHLTLFHQLPNQPEVHQQLKSLKLNAFDMEVKGLINLGAGVAYRIESDVLLMLRKELATAFNAFLIPQDRHGFRPHITIQNKTSPETARQLISDLSGTFKSFNVRATGLSLWVYEGGPWTFKSHFSFDEFKQERP